MKTLTIIEPNRPALLAEIAGILEAAQVNVKDISGDKAGDQAVIRLSAEPYDKCQEVLQSAGFNVLSADHIQVCMPDQPGALAELSRTLANEQIEIFGIHLISKQDGQSVIALEVENPYRARQLLHEYLVRD